MSINVLNHSGAIRIGSLAADPSSPQNGLIYYNTSTGELRAYVDGGWSTVSTGSVSLLGQVLNDGEIVVGNDSNLSAAVDTDGVGDVTADHTAGLTIKSGVVSNTHISASAAIALTKLAALTATRVVVTDGSGFLTVASYAPGDLILRDGTVAFTANQSMGSNKLTNLLDPTSAQDAATKAYVDQGIQGVKPKQACRVATTAALALATDLEDADAVDGVTLATGDRVLVKDQGAPAENGIYIVQASGAAVRATDFDSLSPTDEINGAWVGIQEGTANAGKVFIQYGTVATLGTDAVNFTYFQDLSSLVGGDMITISGSTITVDLATVSGLESSNPGNAAGQLRVKLAASNPALLISGSNELDAKFDNSTIESGASGLQVKDAGITNAKVATGIDAVKIADGSISNTEFQYLNNVSSNIQDQLDAKLENVVEDTTPQLGGPLDLNSQNVEGILKRAALGGTTSFVEEQYLHALTLTASQTNAVESSLTFAHATYEGLEVVYRIKEATTNRVRIGTLRVATNGTDTSVADTYIETGDVGVTWSVAINGANLEVRYTTTANAKTMRADVKRFKA